MSQNEKEHLLTATLAESEQRCAREFERLFSLQAGDHTDTPAGAVWLGWKECWNFLRRETEEWVKG